MKLKLMKTIFVTAIFIIITNITVFAHNLYDDYEQLLLDNLKEKPQIEMVSESPVSDGIILNMNYRGKDYITYTFYYKAFNDVFRLIDRNGNFVTMADIENAFPNARSKENQLMQTQDSTVTINDEKSSNESVVTVNNTEDKNDQVTINPDKDSPYVNEVIHKEATTINKNTSYSISNPLIGNKLGDISRGNHKLSNVTNSPIIIPRPAKSVYAGGFNNGEVKNSSIVNFIDIKGHWAEEQIKKFASNGYINGYDDGSFKPNANITYAEMFTILSNLNIRPVRFSGAMGTYDSKGTFDDGLKILF